MAVGVDHARYQRGSAPIHDLGAGRICFVRWPEPLDPAILDDDRDAKLQLRRGPVRQREVANQQSPGHAAHRMRRRHSRRAPRRRVVE
jgi:hypothetical protein